MRALADGGLRFERVGEPAGARLRIRFAESGNGVYGEARRIQVKGLRGAEISPPSWHERARAPGGRSRLARPAAARHGGLPGVPARISGHALGLRHTGALADIMYNFRYGGGLLESFQRHRRPRKSRLEIRSSSGLSAADVEAVRRLYER
jgi:hypothetical protein